MKNLVFSFLLAFSSNLAAKATDIDVIMQRTLSWKSDAVTTTTRPTLLNNAANLKNTLKTDGSWSSVTYSTGLREYPAFQHLNNTTTMITAYVSSWSSLKGDTLLYSKIVQAFNYWVNNNYKSTNWWFAEIGVPKEIGIQLIMMRATNNSFQKLSASLESSLINRMIAAPTQVYTGANLLDVATHRIYRGCLTNDTNLVQTNFTAIYDLNAVGTGEGIQPDYSYAQHGIQLHLFGYGQVHLTGQFDMINLSTSTIYTIPIEKLSILTQFLRSAVLPVIRGNYAALNTFGRQITRKDYVKADWLLYYLNKLLTIDPQHAAEYANAIARINRTQAPSFGITTATHKHYWRTDYAISSNTNYVFTTRVNSIRSVQQEGGGLFPADNKKGGFLSIGSNVLMQSGNEYMNIYPVWDWTKIPGTTTPQLATAPSTPYITKGVSKLSGGVSNGKIGVSAFAMVNQWKTSANKAWFMFENEIVCLGNDIKSTETLPINTTVNQIFLNGNITVSQNNVFSTLAANAANSLSNTKWVLHDNVAYIFPDSPNNLKVSNKEQSGNWNDIGDLQDKTIITKSIFKLWFDHGNNPQNASYKYIIVPNIKTTNEVGAYNSSDLVIVENSSKVQAVQKLSTNTLQAVFYQPGTITNDGITLTVNKPCAVMLTKTDTYNVEVYVADINREINYVANTIKITFTIPKAPTTINTLDFFMPSSEEEMGKTISQIVSLPNPNGVILGENKDSFEAEESTESSLILFPNPTESIIKVKSTHLFNKISILNSQGNVVRNIKSFNANSTNIDVSDLQEGIYILKTISSTGRVKTRLFSKH